MARNKVDKNSPEFLLRRKNSGRGTLLMILLLTLVNVVFLMMDFGTYFLFSASVPYYLTLMCMDLAGWNPGDPMVVGALVVGAVILAIYLLLWIFSKKSTGCLIAATVFFVVDTLALLAVPTFFYITYGELTVDIIFHVWAVIELILAVSASMKLNKRQKAEAPANLYATDPEKF